MLLEESGWGESEGWFWTEGEREGESGWGESEGWFWTEGEREGERERVS